MNEPSASQLRTEPEPPAPSPWRHLVWLALAAFVFLWFRTAWIGDDAYITLRTVDNFTQGYGLRWNAAERVQTFTHPLWMLLMSGPYALTRSAVWAVYPLSLLCTVGALLLLVFKVSKEQLVGAVALLWLMGSRAFMDFSSSGLENPLSHLLLVFIIWQGLRSERLVEERPADRARIWTLLGCGLLATNRLDLCALVGPLVAWIWWGWFRRPGLRWRGFLSATGRVALGFAPLLLWSAFAIVYYGTPLPITAYAKIGTGIPTGELASQGLSYLRYLWFFDPLTAVGIGLALLFAWRRGITAALLLGVALYLGYIVRVGGDFMGTRFFAAPLLVGMTLLAARGAGFSPGGGRFRGTPLLTVQAAAAIALALLAPLPTWTSGADYGARSEARGFLLRNGIGDERGFWCHHEGAGLWSDNHKVQVPATASARMAQAGLERGVATGLAVGIQGFAAGPRVHIIDPYLCDPLLARLPVLNPHSWRIGHFLRGIPAGYMDTWADWAQGGGASAGPEDGAWRAPLPWSNRLTDPGLARLYEHLRTVWSAPIWDGQRWAAMVSLWLGYGRGDLGEYLGGAYRQPGPVTVPLADLGGPDLAGRPWFLAPLAGGAPGMAPGGLMVELPEPIPAGSLGPGAVLELGLATGSAISPGLRYRITWIHGQQRVPMEITAPDDPDGIGVLQGVPLAIPPAVRDAGCEALLVQPIGNLKHHQLRWVQLR